MPVEIVTVGFCPQYVSQWRVAGHHNHVYDVVLNGAEAKPACSCLAFQYSTDGDCKHVRLIWDHGCLYNPQWKDPGPNDVIEYGATLVQTDTYAVLDQPCPGCGEPMIPVRIAV